MANLKRIQLIALLGIFLAFTVVGLGAWTRLVDAGLGCPDWPGCYGFAIWPMSETEIFNLPSIELPKTVTSSSI